MKKSYEQKRTDALRRGDLWLQEMVRLGVNLSDLPKSDRMFVQRIHQWSRVLVEHDTPQIGEQ